MGSKFISFHTFLKGIFLFCVTVGGLLAQSYQGGLRGTITDAGKAVVPNAKVTLTDAGTKLSRSTLTNNEGAYVFTAVDPATYVITVESPNFKKAERGGVIVATQQFLTLDLSLELGSVSESVMVTEEVPLIESSNASTGQVLDRQKMVDLPNLGRNPFLLSKLSTNVVAVGDPRFNRFQDQSGSSQISVAGGPVRGNNYLIDGVPITDFNNRAVIIPSVEAVQEMKLQANTYDSEMGRTGGGVFNAFLKSGTNDFHGSALGATRQTDWLANNYFYNRSGQARPDTPFYNWAASFGGPVVVPKVYDGRNKTFFWLVTESYRQKSPLSNEFRVPTDLERMGDFSQSGVTIYDPLKLDANGKRMPFDGNRIPLDRIDSTGLNVLSYFPRAQRALPTSGIGTNFTGTDILQDRADEYTAKADHEILPWWKVNASYLHYKSKEPSGNLLQNLPGSGSTLLFRKVDATQVNSIMTPNATTVLSIRYGFNRFPNEVQTASDGFNLSSLGFPAAYANGTQAAYFPEFTFKNLPALSGSGISSSVFHSKNLLVSVSKFMGRHSLKAGMDYRKINVDFLSGTNSAGTFAFSDTFTRSDPARAVVGTGSDVADLLLGYAGSGQVNTNTKLYTHVDYYAGYIQDDFRVSNKLTLNIGLRYEYETGLAESDNRLVVGFDRNAISPISGNGTTGRGALMYAGQNGNPTSCCNVSKTKLGPRFGAAYSLNSKTTIRGGWGIFYAPTFYTSDASFAAGYTQVTPYIGSNDGGATPATMLSNAFASGILAPAGNTLGPATGIGSSVNFLDQNRGSGRVYQYSFDIQRELPRGIALQLGYVGSLSRRLQPSSTGTGLININQIEPRYLSMGAALNNKVSNPFYGVGTGVIGSSTVTQAQLLKPFPQFDGVNAATDYSKARYDSMIIKAQKRMSAGLTFLSTFTWSRNSDSSFGSGNFLSGSTSSPQDIYNLQNEYSLAINDTPLRWVNTISYELPFGKGRWLMNKGGITNLLVGGWQLNVINIYQSGFPLAITQTNLNSAIGAGLQRPNATGVSPSMPGSVQDRLNNYINADAFADAPQFTFGNVARTIGYRGPGTKNWDISLFKNFNIYERVKAEFRAEAMNAFNTPQFRGPNTNVDSSSFGQITQQANFPRYLQLGFRVSF